MMKVLNIFNRASLVLIAVVMIRATGVSILIRCESSV